MSAWSRDRDGANLRQREFTKHVDSTVPVTLINIGQAALNRQYPNGVPVITPLGRSEGNGTENTSPRVREDPSATSHEWTEPFNVVDPIYVVGEVSPTDSMRVPKGSFGNSTKPLTATSEQAPVTPGQNIGKPVLRLVAANGKLVG